MAIRILNFYVSIIQKVIVNIALFMLYVIVFGVIKLCIFVIGNKRFFKADRDTFWETPGSYDNTTHDLERES